LAEALVVACFSNLTQCLPRQGERFSWVQAAFNFNAMALAVGTTAGIYGCSALASRILSSPLRMMVATPGFFLVNTTLVALIMALAEQKHPFRTWAAIFELTFPYYLLSAAIAGVALMWAASPWQALLAMLPLMFVVFGSYRGYFSSRTQIDATAFSKPQPQSPMVDKIGDSRLSGLNSSRRSHLNRIAD
jgi:hypothetical protein